MDNVKSLDPVQLDTKEVHKLLLSSVAPRPIALASTIDSKGNVNLSPFSYFNVFMYAYISDNDKQESKALGNFLKITMNF